ncbi:MAG: hypothetical protein ACRENE_22455 [Polyangiaceae bacterium]
MNGSTTGGSPGYAGPERRRNQVLLTQNSEYLCRDGTCIAVRDRHSGLLVPGHPALGKRVTGGMRLEREGGMRMSPPEALMNGDQLCFSSCDCHPESDVVTGPLSAIVRPAKAWAVRLDKLSS